MWFWQQHGLNELADRDDGGKMGEDICPHYQEIINGGTNQPRETESIITDKRKRVWPMSYYDSKLIKRTKDLKGCCWLFIRYFAW